jgi:RNA polymerase sigma-70 factor, ECF subfamily
MRDLTFAEEGSKRLEKLLAQITAAGNQAAFAELYAATKGKLFSIVLMIVKRRDVAEEIVQDAYARIWSNACSYRPASGSPMSWMITIARNLAIDVVRKPAFEIYAEDSVFLSLPCECPSAVELMEAAEGHRTAMEQRQKLLFALQALNPARRDLVIAAYIYGESRQQLAQRAGVPVNTIKTWIRRALLEVETIIQNSKKNEDMAFNDAFARRRLNDISLEAVGARSTPARTAATSAERRSRC